MKTKRTTILMEERYHAVLLDTAAKLQLQLKKSVGLSTVVEALVKMVDQKKITVEQLGKFI